MQGMTSRMRHPVCCVTIAALLAAFGCRDNRTGADGSTDAGTDLETPADPALDTSGDDDAADTPDAFDAPDDANEEADNPCILPDVTADSPDDVTADLPGDLTADLPGDMDVLDADMDASLDGPDDRDTVEDEPLEDPGYEVVDLPDEEPTTFICGDTLTDGRDGRTYPTVLIGTQCWMAANLDVGTMVLGASPQTDNGIIEKHCYADDPAICAVMGGLYQWNETMDYALSDAANPSTTQGICPSGWHVPSDEEVKELEMFLGMTREEADMINTWRGVGMGTMLLVGGSSGFDALLAGRNAVGVFQLLYAYEYTHTSTEYGSNAWRRCLGATDVTVGRWNTFPKTWSLSVRCVMD